MSTQTHTIFGVVGMRAAQSMGLFLRTWRSEWAGLSRAQLALAVGRAAGRQVAVPVIRAWEEGQAPGSTEELQALLEVMGRHGLSQPEVEQFRHAVFAACLDRHYDGLFSEEPLAQRSDLEQIAEAASVREYTQPGVQSLVALTVAVASLREAWADYPQKATTGRRARALRAALVWMLDAAAHRHGYSGRSVLSARLFAEAAGVAVTQSGPAGLGGRLTEVSLRSLVNNAEYVAGYLSADGAAAGELFVRCAKREASLSEQGWDRGERPTAVVCLARAANYASEGFQSAWAAELLKECDRRHYWVEGWEEVDFQLFWASLNLGYLDRAQCHLEALAHWRGAPFAGCSWALLSAAWALAAGDRQMAEAEAESAVAMAGETAYNQVPLLARRLLGRGEGGLRPARTWD